MGYDLLKLLGSLFPLMTTDVGKASKIQGEKSPTSPKFIMPRRFKKFDRFLRIATRQFESSLCYGNVNTLHRSVRGITPIQLLYRDLHTLGFASKGESNRQQRKRGTTPGQRGAGSCISTGLAVISQFCLGQSNHRRVRACDLFEAAGLQGLKLTLH